MSGTVSYFRMAERHHIISRVTDPRRADCNFKGDRVRSESYCYPKYVSQLGAKMRMINKKSKVEHLVTHIPWKDNIIQILTVHLINYFFNLEF